MIMGIITWNAGRSNIEPAVQKPKPKPDGMVDRGKEHQSMKLSSLTARYFRPNAQSLDRALLHGERSTQLD